MIDRNPEAVVQALVRPRGWRWERAPEETRDAYQAEPTEAGHGPITTGIANPGPFCSAGEYHQQYPHKVRLATGKMGYCGAGGCQVAFPVAVPIG